MSPTMSAQAGRAERIGRAELFLWVAAGCFANQLLLVVDVRSWDALARNIGQLNYIFWFACFVVLRRLLDSDRERAASAPDLAVAAVCCAGLWVSGLLAYRFGLGGIATLLGCYLIATSGGDRHLRAAAAVLLAIATHHLWGPIVFQLLTPELLKADALLVGGLLKVFAPQVAWMGTFFKAPDGHSIMLVGACSSFHNMSTGMLACVSMTMLLRTDWRRRDLAFLLIATAAMVGLNAGRLAVISSSAAAHAYWHDGAGAGILELLQTIVIVLIAYRGAAFGSTRA